MNDDRRRQRRRIGRVLTVLGFMLVAIGVTWFLESQATTTIVFARHADVVDGTSSEAPLTPAGQQRARDLARALGTVDVAQSLDAIFASPNQSSQATVGPLAALAEVPVQTIDFPRFKGLRDILMDDYKGKIVLIVTDRELLPGLVQRMRGSRNLPAIAENEYDNLYIVTIPWYGKVKTLRLKYGAAFAGDRGR